MIKNIKDLKILVVGDIMLDHYIYGDVTRISPEAPVPVVNVTHEDVVLGGCGNVVRNIRALGPNVTCMCAIGADIPGVTIENQLNKLGVSKIMFKEHNKVTTVKSRVVSNNRATQLLRMDTEKINKVNCGRLNLPDKYDIIVVSDYAKGMITEELMDRLRELNTTIIADPKPKNIQFFKDIYMITPNKKEYDEMDHHVFKSIKYILKTLGEEGMELITSETKYKVDSTPIKLHNVVGAGDTVISVMSVCLASGMKPHLASVVANECARYVVTQEGTSVIAKPVFDKVFKEYAIFDKASRKEK